MGRRDVHAEGGGKQYSVVEMSHPENPKGTKWSAYRNYGRFGAFPVATIKAGKPLVLKYRFVIADGEMMPAAEDYAALECVRGRRSQVCEDDGAARRAAETQAASEEPAAKPAREKPQASARRLTEVRRRGCGYTGDERREFQGAPDQCRARWIRRSCLILPPPEPLDVQAALKTFALPEGLGIEPVASEPMVEDPIAISFDELGRMYVVEMRSYMQDADGDREDEPIGRIKRLTDTDGDGRMDKAEVFLDKLVMPRAVLAVRGGVLVGEPPELAFWEDTDNDGKADKKTIVATDYGRRGGQPEHMANTPIVELDNWIYNSSHAARFRFVRGKWISEPTRNRGQWGLSQDDVGRFYFLHQQRRRPRRSAARAIFLAQPVLQQHRQPERRPDRVPGSLAQPPDARRQPRLHARTSSATTAPSAPPPPPAAARSTAATCCRPSFPATSSRPSLPAT